MSHASSRILAPRSAGRSRNDSSYRALLAEVAWVRSLARSLVRDAHRAEDVVQDTLVAAVASWSDPRAESLRSEAGLRRWLGGVVRNVLRAGRRRDANRSADEACSARGERLPSTVELVERAAVQRDLVDAVLALDEPYRSTLLLRYFDELSVEEVARRTGVTPSTVATRTSRALRRLRERLERRSGAGTDAWLAALAPLLAWQEPAKGAPLLASISTLLMSTTTKTILSLTAAAAVFVAIRTVADRPDAPSPRVADASAPAPYSAPEVEAEEEDAPVVPSSQPAREAARPGVVAPAPEASAPVETAAFVRGRVIDLRGAPVAGIVVRTGDPHAVAARTETASDGRFELEGEAGYVGLVVESERYVPLIETYPSQAAPEVVIVVAWRIPFAGIVVDPEGAPIEGAELAITNPRNAIQRLGVVLDNSVPVTLRATSDAQGAFRFEQAAEIEDGAYEVRAAGFTTYTGELPLAGDENVRVVLEPLDVGPDAIVGTVVHPDGTPAEGARVSAGAMTFETDALGEFVIDRSEEFHWRRDDRGAPALVAIKQGYAPARFELPPFDEGERWPKRVQLRLGGADELRAIEGLVVDSEDRPIPGAVVHLLGRRDFGLIQHPGLEFLTGTTIEELLSDSNGRVEADAQGRFRIESLPPHEYRLEVVDERTLRATITDPVEPGADDVVVRIETNALARIAGRVVAPDGTALAGIAVCAGRWIEGFGFSQSERVVTDADGAFDLGEVGVEDVFLSLYGDDIVPWMRHEIPADAERDELELVIGRRCHFQIDSSARASSLRKAKVLDASGNELELVLIRANSSMHTTEAWLGDGLSDVYSVSELADELVITVEGEVVERRPLRLTPGAVERIEL